ncbi:MATE family efflux transporter [Moritella sp. Urea-trap-13]|uniref:MATE family efflux transporter n=1 Tax=Moritella sp. Urea-trap-13 TaxID=2058327 RepID=UPI000C3210CF|nr:MATE family efflux transporter [Moritella sp. Urea-trap-13]PKH07515.1 MATE family efflux transporter [Moritella sp. Urea-trap-13]
MWLSVPTSVHRNIIALALPMILSNISIPLLGLVDSIVIGHLDQAWYLGGVALGSTVVMLIVSMCNFLRMSTTGLTAQAFGKQDNPVILMTLAHAFLIAFVLSILLLLGKNYIVELAFMLTEASDNVQLNAQAYLSIRMWGIPAALFNFAILGWLIGLQNMKAPMLLLIIANVFNIVLDILFVVYFEWGVEGAAAASVIAEYAALLFGLLLVLKQLDKFSLPSKTEIIQSLFESSKLLGLLSLNRDIFIRSLCLQLTFAFMTFKSASLGDEYIAANAVLLNFLMFISFALDGVAYAVEAMVGKAIGAKNTIAYRQSVFASLIWAGVFSLMFSAVFFMFGEGMVSMITDIEAVNTIAVEYLPWLVLLPFTAVWCFVFDGVFIGATRAKDMRNSMLFSVICIFLPTYIISSGLGNHALWLAMNTFMLARGLSLAWLLWPSLQKRIA